MILILGLIIWGLLGKDSRLASDIYGVIFSIASLLELVSMNLLLVSPLKYPVLLLVGLVLFVPIVLIGFSWWYWRLNHLSRIGKAKKQLLLIKKQPHLVILQKQHQLLSVILQNTVFARQTLRK